MEETDAVERPAVVDEVIDVVEDDVEPPMDGWVSVAAEEFLEDLGMGMGVEEEVFITPIFNRHQLLTGYVGMPRRSSDLPGG